MGNGVKKEVKKELIFILLVLCIFVVLVVTWSILGAVDSVVVKSEGVYVSVPPYEGGGQVALNILRETELERGVG